MTIYTAYHILNGSIASKHRTAEAAVIAAKKLRKMGNDAAWQVEIFVDGQPMQPETRDEIVSRAKHNLGLN